MSNKGIQRLSRNVHDSLRSSTFLFDLSRVVEEIVYNSVDAGATKVFVSLSVKSCYIKVEDDGCGITRDGLVIMGERYATSKVHLVANVGTSTETLGFRGEALSSISDVSVLEIKSKACGKPNAYCKIIKQNSKCLLFEIDDQREDVGTTVIVRDLFYNQPIRRKLMHSRLVKELHSVKKCVLRIALVHPQVSFQVIEIEGERKLLCTIPYPSSLPLVTDGFGNEVSSLLREFAYSFSELTLSGYLSGPTDVVSTKAIQYIYINARFVCKGPIHNLINGIATNFQSLITKFKDCSESHCRKRQKTQGYPAYLLNFCCPMSIYDLSFEPSKTKVEFKDWGKVLSFFEEAINSYWKQSVSNPLQGKSVVCEASFHESDILKEVKSERCSTRHMFGEHQDLFKEPFLDKGWTNNVKWCNHALHGSEDLSPKENICNSFLQERMNSQLPVLGALRKCQKWTNKDSHSSFEIGPLLFDQACLTEVNSPSYQKVAGNVDSGSKLGCSHFDLQNPWISRTPPRSQDNLCDSTLIEDHTYLQGFGCKHCSIDEPNAEFLSSLLNESSCCVTDNRFCSSSLKYVQNDSSLDQFMLTEDSLTSIINEEKCSFLPDSSSLRDIYSTRQLNFAMQSYDYAIEGLSNVRRLRLLSTPRRSHSAPPFYKGKKKFPILNCLPTVYFKENFKMKLFHGVDKPGLTCQLEPYSAPQPCTKTITGLRRSYEREFFYEKSNSSSTIEQNREDFDNGSVAADEMDLASSSLSKWRTSIRLPDAVMPQKVDVLDISSGFLHLAGSSLVPSFINKDCLDNAMVLRQLDRKFIPVVASGILVIIDQHAADERIRLEELRKKVLHGELRSTTIFNPELELALPEMGYQLLQKYAEQINKWGWICNIHNPCSESISMSMDILRQQKCRATLVSVPHILGIDLTSKDLLEYIDQLVETDGSSMIPPAVLRLLNYKACRGAIMFGDALLPSECSLIVEELKATSLCFQCAHGRPTTVPLLDMLALHEHLAKIGASNEWHGLQRHAPSIHRAQQRLESCKRFVH